MKPTEIQNLIKFVAKSGVSEVEIEDKDFKITIKTPPHKKGKLVVETPPVVQVQAPVAAPVVTSTPVQEVAAPVPTAPRNLPTAILGVASSNLISCLRNSSNQTAALSPNVIGTAACP